MENLEEILRSKSWKREELDRKNLIYFVSMGSYIIYVMNGDDIHILKFNKENNKYEYLFKYTRLENKIN